VFDEGDGHGHEAIRIAEALDHPFSVLVGCLDLAYLKSIRGELSQTVGLLERVVDQCRDWDITSHAPIALASLGHVYAWSGHAVASSRNQRTRFLGEVWVNERG